MSDKKTIQLNESFLVINNKTKKSRSGQNPKKEKPKTLIKPNKLKKDLLERIKKHQQKEKISKPLEENPNNEEEQNEEFHKDFVSSLDYLNKLSNKQKTRKNKLGKHNKSLKHKSMSGGIKPNLHSDILPFPNDPMISLDLPTDFDSQTPVIKLSSLLPSKPSFNSQNIPIVNPNNEPSSVIQFKDPMNNLTLNPDPKYGCLKGGSKPTYRQFHNKTLKHNTVINHNTPIKHNNPINHTTAINHTNIPRKNFKKFRQKSRKTIKTKYNLGRDNKNRKLSILIKNNNTRRKIKREHGLLKQKPINEIKKYLYERNLLKIGSVAPNDVIRTLYEQSVLAGEINNFSKNISLHNFISNE
jgi:hypothetical protein